MNKEPNIILLSDSYKYSHANFYPPKTEKVYSYLESRGGKFPKVLFFGLQYIIKKYFEGKVVTKEKIDEAEELIKLHGLPFNREGWEYILSKYDGKLPVSIRAVPEGTMVDVSNVLVTMENTDPRCYWLTNFLETVLVQLWYPITVATQSKYIKNMITDYARQTGDESLVNFKLHDFGFRGVSSVESAGIGGAAHLVNFLGTDTVEALVVARDYYGCKIAGYSIPATEHSVITAWGKENESRAMQNVLELYPNGLVACVSDSYDIYYACENIWGDKLKDKVLARNGTLVIRPDSGVPHDVVSKVLPILGKKFGYTVNEKGYKVLDSHVRIIQGDGVNYDSIDMILSVMKAYGWSTDNIAFGMGGALLQNLNRDTQSFAFKCSSVTIDGVEHDVFKQPVTDSGKNSKRGRLELLQDEYGKYHTTREKNDEPDYENVLTEVFNNGNIIKEYAFDEVRENSNK